MSNDISSGRHGMKLTRKTSETRVLHFTEIYETWRSDSYGRYDAFAKGTVSVGYRLMAAEVREGAAGFMFIALHRN